MSHHIGNKEAIEQVKRHGQPDGLRKRRGLRFAHTGPVKE